MKKNYIKFCAVLLFITYSIFPNVKYVVAKDENIFIAFPNKSQTVNNVYSFNVVTNVTDFKVLPKFNSEVDYSIQMHKDSLRQSIPIEYYQSTIDYDFEQMKLYSSGQMSEEDQILYLEEYDKVKKDYKDDDMYYKVNDGLSSYVIDVIVNSPTVLTNLKVVDETDKSIFKDEVNINYLGLPTYNISGSIFNALPNQSNNFNAVYTHQCSDQSVIDSFGVIDSKYSINKIDIYDENHNLVSNDKINCSPGAVFGMHVNYNVADVEYSTMPHNFSLKANVNGTEVMLFNLYSSIKPNYLSNTKIKDSYNQVFDYYYDNRDDVVDYVFKKIDILANNNQHTLFTKQVK